MTIIADGADQVLMRTREQLRLGATQIKVMAGGGVASNYDPLDVSQFTEAEIKAAVDAADNWGTYVAVHAYTQKAITAAVHAGVKCIEHAQLMNAQLTKLVRWYKPYEILRMATSANADLLTLSGKRNPYSEGKLGVIEQEAYADLLLVDESPFKNIKLIEDPEKNFIIIIKDGVIYKNIYS
ncbi:amidohydrolase family protein [Pedobacter sp. ASV1-7]|uniref:amidohydrolase family protein n=1 Tax=Pedobacter sp. ASV1-7 TaxID=3145237 RepID=UPI0032E8C07E